MTIELKNIGMIKEAIVKIDGLTVIAGENDTGKSTLSKALFLAYNSMSLENRKELDNLQRKNIIGKKIKDSIFSKQSFKSSSSIKIVSNNKSFKYKDEYINDELYKKDIQISNIAFIETPLVWNLQYLFRTSIDLESHLRTFGEDIEIPYPFLMKDLYFKLSTQQKYIEDWTSKYREKIVSLIDGEFIKEEDGIFRFYRKNQKFELIEIATGIKYFGVLQVLLDNNRLNSYTLLILDEPEVHLHPEWQLEMAKLVTKLIKNGVKVIINSHSPYMIEALELYAKKEKINHNFYLAEKKDEYATISDVTSNLEPIYYKLAKPIQTLEEQSLENFEW